MDESGGSHKAPIAFNLQAASTEIQRFNEGKTDEMDVVSTLLQGHFQFDVHVIWRHAAANASHVLHGFSRPELFRDSGSTCPGSGATLQLDEPHVGGASL